MLADIGHIVVVDDDPTLRQMVIKYLEEHNIPTRAASNRSELNHYLDGSQPSLIILDLRLGQDDGLDLLREIRSHSDVPVIITTGHRPACDFAEATQSVRGFVCGVGGDIRSSQRRRASDANQTGG